MMLGLTRFLASRNCRVGDTSKRATTLGLVGRRTFSLTLLSMSLTSNGNFSLYSTVGGSCGVPMVFLATSNSRCDAVAKFRLNTSSCVTGPFEPERLTAEVGGVLHLAGNTNSLIRLNGIFVSAIGNATDGGNGSLCLSTLRCQLLLIFLGGEKVILAEGRLLRSV